jgi:hypothetical protein
MLRITGIQFSGVAREAACLERADVLSWGLRLEGGIYGVLTPSEPELCCNGEEKLGELILVRSQGDSQAVALPG